jgi:hypothetical protein
MDPSARAHAAASAKPSLRRCVAHPSWRAAATAALLALHGHVALAQDVASASDAEEVPAQPAGTDAADPASEAPSSPPEAAPDAAEDEDEDEAEVVLVVGRQAIRDARDRVVRKLEDLGFKATRRSDDVVILRPPESWMGKAKLFATGDLAFGTPLLFVSGPRETGGDFTGSRGAAPLDNDQLIYDRDGRSGTVGVSVGAPSKRKVDAIQARVRAEVEPLVLDYRAKLQAAWLARYVGALPERLDAVWRDGTPLGEAGSLDTWSARRGHVLDFWATRTDTPEGRVVSRVVEQWLRAVVQPSEHPLTAEEIAAAESRRDDGRRLVMAGPEARAVDALPAADAP